MHIVAESSVEAEFLVHEDIVGLEESVVFVVDSAYDL